MFTIIIGIALLLMAAFMLWIGVQALGRVVSAKTFLETQGIVSKITERRTVGFIKKRFIEFITVRYKVDGETYEQEYPEEKTNWEYIAGQKITIRYNPKKPKIYLIPGEKTILIRGICHLAIGVIFAFFGVFAFFVATW